MSVVESKILSFSGQGLKLDTAADADPIIRGMKETKFTEFNLSGNTLGVEAAKEVGKELESHAELKVAIWKDLFTGRLKEEIPEAMRYLGGGLSLAQACLTELDLSDNAFGPIGMEGVVHLLSSPICSKLKILRMNNNGLGTKGGKMLCNALRKSNKKLKQLNEALSLEVIVCGRNRLEQEGARELAALISELGCLKEISIPQNGINKVGMAALFEAFCRNPALKVINVSDNTITPKGTQTVAEALNNLSNLEVLDLSECLLRDGGAIAISKAVQNLKKLKELHLNGNEIKIDGALSVISSLSHHKQLTCLNLNENSLGSSVELVKEKLAKQNQLPVLESLSDDEGSEEEEENEEGESEDQEDEEESEDEKEEGTSISGEEDGAVTEEEEGSGTNHWRPNGLSLNELNHALDNAHNGNEIHTNDENTDFLHLPSLKSLSAMGSNWSSTLVKQIQLDQDPEGYIDAFVKLASVFPNANKETKEGIVSTCQTLLKEAFALDYPESIVTNALLVNLGLLKSEDKKKLVDLNGPIKIVGALIDQLPTGTLESLEAFLSQPTSTWDSYAAALKELTTAVYQRIPIQLF